MDLVLFAFFISKYIKILRYLKKFQDTLLFLFRDHQEMYHEMNECQLISPELFPNNLFRKSYQHGLWVFHLLLLIINLLSLIYFN